MDNSECRICYEYIDIEENNELLNPCNCNLPIHKTCLIQWIKSRPNNQNKLKCEICSKIYNITFNDELIEVNINSINSYEYRQNVLFYNRIYLICVLHCCNLCSKLSFFFIISSLIYIIFQY